MHLYLADAIQRLQVTPAYFFRLAHQWRFNRDADTTQDALAYKVGGVVPEYVREYIHHIQSEERRAPCYATSAKST